MSPNPRKEELLLKTELLLKVGMFIDVAKTTIWEAVFGDTRLP